MPLKLVWWRYVRIYPSFFISVLYFLIFLSFLEGVEIVFVLLRCSNPHIYGTNEHCDGNEVAKLLLISTSAADVEFTVCSSCSHVPYELMPRPRRFIPFLEISSMNWIGVDIVLKLTFLLKGETFHQWWLYKNFIDTFT